MHALLALAWALATPLAAQTPTALTLREAYSEALHNNLQLMAERLELSVADAERIAARIRPNPTVSYDMNDHTVSVGVPIETGGKRGLRIENAGETRRIAELQFEDAARRLQLDVAAAYADAIRAEQRAQLAKGNLELLEGVVQVNTVRVSAGAVAPLELTRSQTAMYLVRSDAARADLDVATALLRLRNLIGRRDGGETPLKLDTGEPAAVMGDEAQALARRPDLLAARLAVEQRDAALRLAIAQSRPDPIVGMSRAHKSGDTGASYSLNLTVPLPLFDRNQGDIARARAEKALAVAQVAALEAQVRTEVRTALGQYRASQQIVDRIRADLLPAAQKARDTAAYVYRTHASSLLEFLDAERAWNETMDSYFDAEAAVRTAAFQLDAAMGGSHEEDH